MKGILKKIELKEFTKSSNNQKFKRVQVTVDVENEHGDIRTLKGTMSEDYAKRYFKFCGETTKTALGKPVEVVTARKKFVVENAERIYTYIKFMNFVNDKGEPIIMPKDDAAAVELDW